MNGKVRICTLGGGLGLFLALGCLAVQAADDAFGFLDGDGESLSLFGVRLGQRMDDAEFCPSPHYDIRAKSGQYEYCRFTPSGEAADSRFRNYTV